MDASALSFVLSQSLAAKKHKEQKKREEEAKEALLAWSQRRGKVRWAVSETVVLAGRREVTVHMMPSAGRSPESPGPGEDYRRLQGWTPLLRTPNSGVWVCRGALRVNQLLAALVSSVDWVVRGTYRTARAVTQRCRCPYAYGRGVAVGPQTGERS